MPNEIFSVNPSLGNNNFDVKYSLGRHGLGLGLWLIKFQNNTLLLLPLLDQFTEELLIFYSYHLKFLTTRSPFRNFKNCYPSLNFP